MGPLELLSQWSFDGVDWLVIAVGVVVAYIVFGIAGFGTALVAGPILILFMPLSKIIPLLVLLDFVAAFGNLLPNSAPNNPPTVPMGIDQPAASCAGRAFTSRL